MITGSRTPYNRSLLFSTRKRVRAGYRRRAPRWRRPGGASAFSPECTSFFTTTARVIVSVDLADVIQTLADALRATFSDRVRLRVVADHVLVESRLAIPLSLLVNEAVTNAYKHAYPSGQSGEIFVRIANQADGSVTIAIRDDGVGFAPDVREGALGLTLMRSFASQLGGELAILSESHGPTRDRCLSCARVDHRYSGGAARRSASQVREQSACQDTSAGRRGIDLERAGAGFRHVERPAD